MGPTLSLCMIVRDEEQNLGRCLASVAGGVDEIVVCDTGSVDRTKDIAREHGAVVVERAWTDDFAAARNHAIEHATQDWVLILDADETVDEGSRLRLKEAIAKTPAEGLKILTRSLLPPGEIARFTDLVQTRLFVRRPEHRYEGKIHEQISPAILKAGGKIADADLLVLHHGYEKDTAQGKDRGARNLALLQKQAKATPNDPYILYNLGATYKNLGQHGEARKWLEAAAKKDNGKLNAGTRARLHMALAQIALGAHQDAVAAQHARKTLAASPDNPVALQILALGLLSTNDVAGAVEAFQKLRRSPAVDPGLAADIDKVLASLGH